MGAREELSAIINFDDRKAESVIRKVGGYGSAGVWGAGSGSLAGMLVGGANKKSAVAGAAIGGGAALIARAKLEPRIAKAELQNRDLTADALSALPGLAGLGAAGLIIGKGKSVTNAASRAGSVFRNVKEDVRHAAGGMRNSWRNRPNAATSIVPDVPSTARPLRKMLMSARDELDSIIELKAVDLGYSYNDMGCGYPSSTAPSKKYFPTLYVNDRDDEINLPLSGTAKIKFKLRSQTTRQDENGKKRHSADIEVQSIDPIEEEVVAPKEGGAAKPIKMSARHELDSILQFARGDMLIKSLIAHQGAVEVPELARVVNTIATKSNPVNAANRIAIASQIRGYRNAGVLKPITKGAGVDIQAAGDKMTSTPLGVSAFDGRKRWNTIHGGGSLLQRKVNNQEMSVRDELQSIMNLAADPRPRNNLGMFEDAAEGGPNPDAIGMTYKSGLAAAGVGAAGGLAVKTLMGKLKKA